MKVTYMSEIKTQRLLLRPFRQGDAEAMFKNWTSDEDVARYCSWDAHKNPEDSQWLLDYYLEKAKDGFEYRWAVTEQGEDEPIGAVDVTEITDAGKTAELGYVLAKRFWGRGYVTEAASAVIEELFKCGFEKIIAVHHIDNPASGRVMEKCGMKFVGESSRKEKMFRDDMCTVRVYEIMRSDVL